VGLQRGEAGGGKVVQLLGRPYDEATVLRAAHAYEEATSWSRRPPDLA
jgi:aspartyl-tRNA(Asn)/glutamyl-tRNA(Gln) amidotransferase subunit A